MRKGKVISLISLTTVSALILGAGITYAWYANGEELRLGNMNIALSAEPELSIGIKQNDGEIKYYQDQLPKEAFGDFKGNFKPVSTMYKSTWLGSDEFPRFKDTYTRPIATDESSFKMTNDADGDQFLSMELYLKSTADVYVGIDPGSTWFKGNDDINKDKAKGLRSMYSDLTEDEIRANLNKIEKSMRFSILDGDKFHIIDPHKESETTFAAPLDLNADKFYDVYSKDGETREFLFGEYQNADKIVYKDNATTNYSTYTAFDARHMAGVKSIDMAESIKNGLEVAVEDSMSLEDVGKNAKLIPLRNNTPKRIVFSIYIEGWDRDNTTLSAYGAFLASIKLKVTRENFDL
ncbi:MAG: hypothetical protein MJ220_03840 [Bacilli bacterium]|nr:hypothetical protein [Bacilli bacterium]